MSKYNLYAIIIFVFGSIVFAYFMMNLGSSTPTTTPPAQPLTQNPLPPSQNTPKNGEAVLGAPVKITNNGLVSITGISYKFTFILENVLTIPNGLELIPSMKTQDMPAFVVTENTPIYKYPKGQPTKTDLSSLGKGKTISVNDYYAYKTRSWTISKVDIIKDVPKTSTAPASIK